MCMLKLKIAFLNFSGFFLSQARRGCADSPEYLVLHVCLVFILGKRALTTNYSLLYPCTRHIVGIWWSLLKATVEFYKCMASIPMLDSSLCFTEIQEHCSCCMFIHQSFRNSYGVWKCTQLLTVACIPRRPPSKSLPLGFLFVSISPAMQMKSFFFSSDVV